jgi:hypothetical protein
VHEDLSALLTVHFCVSIDPTMSSLLEVAMLDRRHALLLLDPERVLRL